MLYKSNFSSKVAVDNQNDYMSVKIQKMYENRRSLKMKRIVLVLVSVIIFSFSVIAGETVKCALRLPDGNTIEFEVYRSRISDRKLCVSSRNNSQLYGATVELTIYYTYSGRQYSNIKIVTINPGQLSGLLDWGCPGSIYSIELPDFNAKADAIVAKVIQTSSSVSESTQHSLSVPSWAQGRWSLVGNSTQTIQITTTQYSSSWNSGISVVSKIEGNRVWFGNFIIVDKTNSSNKISLILSINGDWKYYTFEK